MKSYSDVFGLIADYCNSDMQTLPLFADAWSRWPTGKAAHIVITRIAQQADFWESRRPSIANALREAQIAIRNNL